MGDTRMLPQEVVSTIAEIASNAAIAYYKDELRKYEKKNKSDKIKKVKNLLAAYRRTVAKLNDESQFTEEEKAEYRWKFIEDLMGSSSGMSKSDRIIADEEKRRQEDMYAVYRIENAMRLYKEECDRSSSAEEKRRYRAIMAMYIDDEAMTVQEIAAVEKVSEKTVYRDIGIAYQILAIYLYGI